MWSVHPQPTEIGRCVCGARVFDESFRDSEFYLEFETNLRRERQGEGIAAAKQRGAYRGRPPRIDLQAIQHRLARGLSPTQIARELGVSHGTVYKAGAGMTHGA